MAVDGRKLRSSIYQGSDDYCEFPCSSCSKEGGNVAAIKHCVDCDENFCSSCLKDHNKFSVMRSHQMLDKVQSPSGASPQLPKQRCTKHGGKVIDVYCPGHDTVCCSTCIAVDHSTCQGITFIPDVAKNIRTSNELEQFESKTASLKSRCIFLSQSTYSNTQTLKQDKIKLLEEIRKFRQKINDHFDKMEKRLIDEADVKFNQKMKNVDDERKEIQDILEDLRKTDQRLQAAKHENESEIFAILKSESASLDKKIVIVDKMVCAGTTNSLKLKVEKMVETVVDKDYGLGEVNECSQTVVSSFHGDYNTKAETDTDKCNRIDGICLCQGHMFLIDYNNKRLKKLDINYKMVSCLDMPDVPANVCNVNNEKLAVTLINDKKVQFVSCTEPMQLLTSFSVGDRCRGIEYNNGLLFVCCGGEKYFQEGPGHLEIYSENGMLMRSINDMTRSPTRLSVTTDGKYVYVTHWDHGLTIFGAHGDIIQQCQYQELKAGSAICRISANLLCITGRESDNIAVISNVGQMMQILITNKENIKWPLALCFDEKQSRLIVSSYGSDSIKVFKLNI